MPLPYRFQSAFTIGQRVKLGLELIVSVNVFVIVSGSKEGRMSLFQSAK